MIKNKLLDYEPDLFIVYDGWNDVQNEVHNKNNNGDMLKKFAEAVHVNET